MGARVFRNSYSAGPSSGEQIVPRVQSCLKGKPAGESDWVSLRGVKIRTAVVVGELLSCQFSPGRERSAVWPRLRRFLGYPGCQRCADHR